MFFYACVDADVFHVEVLLLTTMMPHVGVAVLLVMIVSMRRMSMMLIDTVDAVDLCVMLFSRHER